MNTVVFFKHPEKLATALSRVPFKELSGQQVLVKLHMGEKHNPYFMKPEFVKQVVDELKAIDADPFLFDTTVAYHGSRYTKEGYLKLASHHGFTPEQVGCEVVIDDTGVPTTVEGRTYEVATHLKQATHVLALSHVKGHIQTGMGGAIKNFGMGGVTKETKTRMHDGSYPVYHKDACTLCGVCAEACPFQAITVTKESWKYHKNKCLGCGACVDECPTDALRYQDADLQYLLACSAKACVRKKNIIYINELKRISRGCDCDPRAGPIICPDIGYLVATDPVAIDKATLDVIHTVKPDVFKKINKINPFKQVTYGEEIGLGSSQYQLIEV
ncbi:MAG: DUF362 domain-containing protein [Candidatus Thermoplasmatota archaeon]|nr:DUF362 domain-containing protein [Candidatus Thermoplasmatota archaeon]